MSSTPVKKPKQLRPFTWVVMLIELGLALWALTVMRRYWQAADALSLPSFGQPPPFLGFAPVWC